MEETLRHFDEDTWEELDPELVKVAEQDEMERFRKMGVYHVPRHEAERDPMGKFGKVKWVRTNKGTTTSPKVRCRLVAQELGFGSKEDELFAGTPSMTAVKMILAKMANNRSKDMELMVVDVKCAFLYGKMRRNVYIELPTQDEQSMNYEIVGKLDRAMYGTRDAPLIWQGEVRRVMHKLGFVASMLQPGVYHHPTREIDVVVHVDDFLCTGRSGDLEWFEQKLKEEYDVSATRVGPDHHKEVKYLNRTLRWTDDGIEVEGDRKHADMLIKEWGMKDCKTLETPIGKEVAEKLGEGVAVDEGSARRARRAIARINYMSQDRPDLSVAARLLSQRMAKPTSGTEVGMKRVIRYLRHHPVCCCLMRWNGGHDLKGMTDSDWAGDIDSRKSVSGGGALLRQRGDRPLE